MLVNEASIPEWYAILYPYVIFPLIHGTVITTVYTVVVLSFERLHAICSPLTHEPYFWPYFLMILSSPFSFIVPLFFHHYLEHDKTGHIIGFSPGLIDQNKIYKIYWESGILVIGSIIPMVLLIRNNIIIYSKLRNTSKIKRNKTAVVLFATVMVFFICHSFRYVVTGFIFFNPITIPQKNYCAKQGR